MLEMLHIVFLFSEKECYKELIYLFNWSHISKKSGKYAIFRVMEEEIFDVL